MPCLSGHTEACFDAIVSPHSHPGKARALHFVNCRSSKSACIPSPRSAQRAGEACMLCAAGVARCSSSWHAERPLLGFLAWAKSLFHFFVYSPRAAWWCGPQCRACSAREQTSRWGIHKRYVCCAVPSCCAPRSLRLELATNFKGECSTTTNASQLVGLLDRPPSAQARCP